MTTGSRRQMTGLLTHGGMKKFWSFEETRRRKAHVKASLAPGKGRRFKSDQPHHLKITSKCKAFSENESKYNVSSKCIFKKSFAVHSFHFSI